VRVWWNLRDASGRIWHDDSADRLRAWVRWTNEGAGIHLEALPPLFKSENHGCGYAVPRDFHS
jgi:hypothetical protein